MALKNTSTEFFVDRELRRIEMLSGTVKTLYPLNPLPEPLFEAMLNLTDYNADIDSSLLRFYSSHVYEAVVCTINEGSPFPINTASKGIYLVPSDEVIDDIIDDIEGQLLSFQGRPFKDTIEERFRLFRDIYIDESKVDRFKLGSLEIYGGRTYRNLLRDPKATLHMNWMVDRLGHSFQLKSIVEIVPRGTPFYRFVRLLRQLFSSMYADLLGKGYVCGYKFWICEATGKDPMYQVGF